MTTTKLSISALQTEIIMLSAELAGYIALKTYYESVFNGIPELFDEMTANGEEVMEEAKNKYLEALDADTTPTLH